MKNVLEIFKKLKPATLIKRASVSFEEDDFEMEEYHNPFLGIYCYVEKTLEKKLT